MDADEVRRFLVDHGQPATSATIAAAYRAVAGSLAPAAFAAGVRRVEAELLGAGVLQPLLDDESVCDVLVHGGGEVWADRGAGLAPSGLRLAGGEEQVRALAVRLVTRSGRRLDAAQPFADGVLPSGHRVHAVIPPVAADGTCISIRAVRPFRFDLAGLVAAGTVAPAFEELLRTSIAFGIPLLISGQAGVGKTTLLAALLAEIDAASRIVLIEDTSEVLADHPQLVRLQGRAANVEGAGAVSLRDLVRQALRMRPDRLVLGEVRGAEVVDLLVALNTGHGGLCTLHANAVRDVPSRLEGLAALAGTSRPALHSLLAGSLPVVVHLERVAGERRVVEMGVSMLGPDGLVGVSSCLRLDRDRVVPGPGLDVVERRFRAVRLGSVELGAP